MREDIFALMKAVRARQQSPEAQKLYPEAEHLLNRMYSDFVKNGLNLKEVAERHRLAEIRSRINHLAAAFDKNVAQATSVGGVWYAPDELPGMPDDELAGMERGTGVHEAKVFASFSDHERLVMRLVTNADSRKRMLIARANRCNENVPIFHEVTVLRDEAARLLGYPSHAALSVEDKMARNTETVKTLLYSLRDRLLPAGRRELLMFQKLKRTDCEARGVPWDGHYFVWDQPFYNRMLLAKEYQVDHQKIAEYFPLETTVSGMLDIFAHLFGLVFSRLPTEDADGNSLVWHPDVWLFAVWDDEAEGGGFLGVHVPGSLFSRI